MERDVEYEIQRLKERLEAEISRLDNELRLVISRKADKEHSHEVDEA